MQRQSAKEEVTPRDKSRKIQEKHTRNHRCAPFHEGPLRQRAALCPPLHRHHGIYSPQKPGTLTTHALERGAAQNLASHTGSGLPHAPPLPEEATFPQGPQLTPEKTDAPLQVLVRTEDKNHEGLVWSKGCHPEAQRQALASMDTTHSSELTEWRGHKGLCSWGHSGERVWAGPCPVDR